MLYLEVQEGERKNSKIKVRGRLPSHYQATTACTVRMLAALSLDENSLPPDINCTVLILEIRGSLPMKQ